MGKVFNKKRFVFSASFLVISCVLSVIALYIINYIPRVPDISAYDFFRSFMPDEEIGYNDNGDLVWFCPWNDGRFNFCFCDELKFPENPSLPYNRIHSNELYPNYDNYIPPRQNTYTINIAKVSNGSELPFEVSDKDGNLLQVDFGLGDDNELEDVEMYLLKYLNGAWYRMIDAGRQEWVYAQEAVELCLNGGGGYGDKDFYTYPIPSGHYALALCALTGEECLLECYALAEFDLICDYSEDKYLIYSSETGIVKNRDMNLKYHVRNVEPTIYYDPYA